jgi:uncharacterized protein (TIGR02217 family)
VALANGFEERNAPWAHSRRRYDAGLGLRSLDDLAALVAFFEARRGQLYGFRWKDWSDFKSCSPSQSVTPFDQRIGRGDDKIATFALSKRYSSGEGSYQRPVAKPVAGTVRVAVGGVPRKEGVDWTLDTVAGTVTFEAQPEPGAEITAGFEFDVPVRFDTDRIQVSVASFRAGEAPSVPVVEVRL